MLSVRVASVDSCCNALEAALGCNRMALAPLVSGCCDLERLLRAPVL